MYLKVIGVSSPLTTSMCMRCVCVQVGMGIRDRVSSSEAPQRQFIARRILLCDSVSCWWVGATL